MLSIDHYLKDGLDSKEEVYFFWWLEQLQNRGYIQSFERAETIKLSDKIVGKWLREFKRKEDEWKEEFFDHPSEYTPDFKIIWDKSAEGLFYELQNSKNKVLHKLVAHNPYNSYIYSVVEIKPTFDFHGKTNVANIKRKWAYQKTGTYVNLVKIPTFFEKNFTPERFLYTDKSMTRRVFKKTKGKEYTLVTLNQYIHSVKANQ